MKGKIFYFLVLSSVLILSGCATRTYSISRDRVDQDFGDGNRGYLIGKPKPGEGNLSRKSERTVRIFEIEFGKPYRAKQVNTAVSATPGAAPEIEGSAMEMTETEPMAVSGQGQKYTVGKNDTLQKISKKFYGTTKKWMKIYHANQDVLKGPDKVYPGQVLNIPDASGTNTPVETLNEPKENLK